MSKVVELYAKLDCALDAAAAWVGLLAIRLLLGWEYWDAGITKFRGNNWFQNIQDDFPFPFNLISPDISWFLATWFEMLGGIAIAIGLATRFFSASLIVLTVVAIAAVHWPADWSSISELAKGYAISDDGFGNYKLPLIFLVMFIPLLLQGPGKASLDHWIARRFRQTT